MECMYGQTRPWFILSSKTVFWGWVEGDGRGRGGDGVIAHVNSKGNIPSTGKKFSTEDRTLDTA